jgi:hypothetical protein
MTLDVNFRRRAASRGVGQFPTRWNTRLKRALFRASGSALAR